MKTNLLLEINPVSDDKLFQMLFKYQCYINIPDWLGHSTLKDGKLVTVSGYDAIQGVGENMMTHGFLIAVGNRNFASLLSDRNRENEKRAVVDVEPPNWIEYGSIDGLFNFFEKEKETSESSYGINLDDRMITQLFEFNNSISLPEGKVFTDYLPRNFLSLHADVKSSRIGLKTRNAIRLAVFYEVHTYQIKSTPYANAGIGKVIHLDKWGIVEEVFFPIFPGDLREPVTTDIIGDGYMVSIYRGYRDKQGKPFYKDGKPASTIECIVDKDFKFCRPLDSLDYEHLKKIS